MKFKHNLAGQKFGMLTALYPINDNSHRAKWHCICECGNEKDVLQQNLSNGHVRSCGCLRNQTNSKRIAMFNSSIGRESHDSTKTRLYRIWVGIKQRCYTKSASSYHNYGGRGIQMCCEWRNSFSTFKEWALKNGYSDSLTIDRIDPNGDYYPENCRWVDMSVQSFNKRLSPRNTSGTTGVSYNKRERKWIAYISKDHKTIYIGCFNSIEEAIKARKDAESELLG